VFVEFLVPTFPPNPFDLGDDDGIDHEANLKYFETLWSAPILARLSATTSPLGVCKLCTPFGHPRWLQLCNTSASASNGILRMTPRLSRPRAFFFVFDEEPTHTQLSPKVCPVSDC
jgi:hypothetical protein